MQCSCTAIFLFTVSILGTLVCCISGIFALNGTLELFKTYGPIKDRGNPALDPAPKYWRNPETGVFEPQNYNNRGNLVPQVFDGIKYYFIALAVLMVINCFLFLIVSVRTKKVVNNRGYQGKRNSLSCIGCVGWLAGYLAFLSILWLVMACFAVLPLVEYVITMQRCWDLASTNWSPGTREKICVDLVQYGLVFFKETSDEGYALMCGPGGNHDPPLGDLEGFCNNYYSNFCLYLTSFIGACVTLFGMVLFAMRLVSTFVYLKVRKFENPNGIVAVHDPYYLSNNQSPTTNFVPNPNYEQNLLSHHYQTGSESVRSGSYAGQSAVSDAIELKQRLYNGGNSSTVNSERRYPDRGYSFNSDLAVPPYSENYPPSYHSSNKSHRRKDGRSNQGADNRRRRDRRERSRRRSRSRDSDPDLLRHEGSDRSSGYHRSRNHRYRRSRASMSDLDRRRSQRQSRHDSYYNSQSSD